MKRVGKLHFPEIRAGREEENCGQKQLFEKSINLAIYVGIGKREVPFLRKCKSPIFSLLLFPVFLVSARGTSGPPPPGGDGGTGGGAWLLRYTSGSSETRIALLLFPECSRIRGPGVFFRLNKFNSQLADKCLFTAFDIATSPYQLPSFLER